MAQEIEVPGSGQSIDFSGGLSGIGTDVLMVFLSFLFAVGLGSAAVWFYNNVVAENTPDQIGKIDVMTEP